jgi:zinc protease
VSDDELEQAKNRFVRSTIFARDRQSSMANIYGSTLATGGTVEDIEQWPQRIRNVTAQDVKSVAGRYLVPEHATTGYLLPEARAGN